MDGSDQPKPQGLAPRWQQRQQQQQQQQQQHQSQQAQQYSTQRSDDPTQNNRRSAPLSVADTQIDVAKRFLKEYNVRTASRDKKIAFLRSKGVSEDDIRDLMDAPNDDEDVEVEEHDQASHDDSTEVYHEDDHESNISSSSSSSASWPWPKSAPSSSSSTLVAQRPPIVTYPEFLAKQDRPGPLVTKTRLVNTLCAVTGLSAILYGASKFVVNPMIESLTEARVELHETTSKKLDDMVSKLEDTVSVVPPKKSPADSAKSATDHAADDDDDYDDPSEMFHRDIGTQTSYARQGTGSSSPSKSASTTDQHAARISQFTRSLASLKDDFRSQDRGLRDVETVLDLFRDELDGMAYGKGNDFVGGFDMYGNYRRSEPEDDIRKARDNIRRIKGVLLSTRNFPTTSIR